MAGDYQLFPKAQDTAGVNEPTRYYVPFQLNDPSNSPPAVAITAPASGENDFTTNTIAVSGTAADPDGVQTVQLSFYNQSQQGYLQADGTIGDYTPFTATIGSPTGSVSPWSYTVTLPNGEYTMNVNAVDTKGAAMAEAVSRGFVMTPGNPPPTLTIDSPVNGARITDTVTVSGSATDNTSVHRVLVRVADTRFGLGPQIGGGFGSAAFVPATLASPDAATSTWSITFTGLPVGAYTISAYAEDAAGVATATASRPLVQVQQRPAAAPTTEPATTITSPDPTAFRAGDLSVPLAGTAAYARRRRRQRAAARWPGTWSAGSTSSRTGPRAACPPTCPGRWPAPGPPPPPGR